MQKSLHQILEQIIPFIILGIAIAFGIALLIMFSYLLIWGLVIGGILWLVYFIKNVFFSKKSSRTAGRIIEHNDKD